MTPEERKHLDDLVAQSKQRLARIIDLEDAGGTLAREVETICERGENNPLHVPSWAKDGLLAAVSNYREEIDR